MLWLGVHSEPLIELTQGVAFKTKYTLCPVGSIGVLNYSDTVSRSGYCALYHALAAFEPAWASQL